MRRCRIQWCLQRHPVCLHALLLAICHINCHGPNSNNNNQCALAFGMIAISSQSAKASLLPRDGKGRSSNTASVASVVSTVSSASTILASSSRIVIADEEPPSSTTSPRRRQQQQQYPPHATKGRRERTLSTSIAPATSSLPTPSSQGMTKEASKTRTTKIMDAGERPTPWNADYANSLRTQQRIQKAAVQAEANIRDNRNRNRINHNHHHRSKDYNHQHDDDDNNNNAYLAKQAICTILQTLHNTPPEFCNAANLVCALTLSSKIWERSKVDDRTTTSSGSGSIASSSFPTTTIATTATSINKNNADHSCEIDNLYAALFTQTLSTLSDLVSIPNRLSPRQLCNAAWSLAKFALHHDHADDSFTKSLKNKLSGGGKQSSFFTTATPATARTTTWNLRQENDQEGTTTQTILDDGATTAASSAATSPTSSRRMDGLIDEVLALIAQRVIDHLEEIQRNEVDVDVGDDDDGDNDNSSGGGNSCSGNISKSFNFLPSAPRQHPKTNIIRPGEISMLLWAYATVGPRDRPPGWESPRRLEWFSSSTSIVSPSSSSQVDRGDGGGDNSINGHSIGVDTRKKKVGYVTTPVTTVENEADFVTFVESNSFSTSTLNDDAPRSSPDGSSNTVDRLFDAVAIALCRGEGAQIIAEAEAVEEDRKSLLPNFSWRELSNVAWSYATRGAYKSKESERMMSFLAREATSRLRSCTLGNTAAAPAAAASNVTTGAREKNNCNFLPRDAIQIAWALGTMESDNVNSGDALVYLVDSIHDYWIHNGAISPTKRGGNQQQQMRQRRPLAHWTCADLVQLATAMAHGRLDNQSVLEAIFRESLERISGNDGGGRVSGHRQRYNRGFSTAEISILMWVQARLYLTPKFGDVYAIFPNVASREILRRMGRNDAQLVPKRVRQIGLGPQEQANLAWSLTVLENYCDSVVTLLQNIFHAASSILSSSPPSGEDDERAMQLEHAHQLWQSYFLLRKDCPYATKFIPLAFSNYLEEKWKQEKSRSKQSSSRHKAISQTLNLMKVAHRNEYDEDVDVAIVLEESSAWTHTAEDNFDGLPEEGHRKVAVEFDGPHHFTRSASTTKDLSMIEGGTKITPRVLGHTVLKYRLLKRKGWTVIRIPYYEFDKIPFWASMERQRYLQRALKTHEKIEFSGIDISEYKAMPSTRHSRFD